MSDRAIGGAALIGAPERAQLFDDGSEHVTVPWAWVIRAHKALRCSGMAVRIGVSSDCHV
jgi:hypothetical protein